jgi:molecular chaperone DnaJ
MRDLGGLGGMFGDFHTQGTREAAHARGEDLRATVSLTLKDIAAGVEKKIRFKRLVTCEPCAGTGSEKGESLSQCPDCAGAGQVQRVRQTLFGRYATVSPCRRCRGRGQIVDKTCPECRGDGRAEKSETISVKIPAGVSAGNYIPLTGKGNIGPWGGEPGDLIVFIDEEEDPVFERHEQHVLLDIAITMSQAALGDEIEVPTVTGRVKLQIPKGTETGRIFRLRGKGMPKLHGRGVGDQLVRVNVWTPRKLTNKQKALYKELGALEQMDLPPMGKAVLERMRRDS